MKLARLLLLSVQMHNVMSSFRMFSAHNKPSSRFFPTSLHAEQSTTNKAYTTIAAIQKLERHFGHHHIELSWFQQSPQSAMFGSSQDRARQLAGRNRRQRISSSGSCSSSRSTSSSHDISELCSPTTLLDPNAELPPVEEEQPFQETARSFVVVSDPRKKEIEQDNRRSTSHSASTLPIRPRNLQLEQHRLQAEHLSQVLYNTLSLPKSAATSHDLFRSSHHVEYGSLGISGVTSSNIRNTTAPCQATYFPNSPVFDLMKAFDSSKAPFPRASASEFHLRPQPVVSLRGGYGRMQDPHDQEAEYALQAHTLRVQNHRDFGIYTSIWGKEVSGYHQLDLAEKIRWLPPQAWNEPITAGLSYEEFLSLLDTTQTCRFGKLFGPSPRSNFPRAPCARVAFLHSLDEKLRVAFVNAMKGSISYKREPEIITSTSDNNNPPVMLSLLLSAAEEFVQLILAYH